MSSKIRLPIGYDDFGKVMDEKLTVVDKSLFIKEVAEDPSEVIVILRPRRFGKTFALSWLHYFHAPVVYGRKTEGMFSSFLIAKESEIMSHQGQSPVIALTLKGIKDQDYPTAYRAFCEMLSQLYLEHRYLMVSDQLVAVEKESFNAILTRTADLVSVKNALKNLARYLHQHHGKRPWLLIDEYDTPIQHAYVKGYYNEMVDLLRDFFSEALKNNPYLHKAVLTGILRVAKESMFSGLNNVRVCSLFSDRYSEHFGFTEAEVDDLLAKADLAEHDRDDVRRWYNGYRVGETTIYNPWSIANYIDERKLQQYWVNTSSNDVIKLLMAKSDVSFKQKLESLLRNVPVDGFIDESIVFRYLDGDETSLFSLLFAAGYLKAIEATRESSGMRCRLLAPNYEILLLYKAIVENWFTESGMTDSTYQQFLNDLVEGRIEPFAKRLKAFLEHSASYFDVKGDEPEKFYHGFVLGLIASLEKTHTVKSNRESGDGRYDVMLIPHDKTKLGLVLEFKTAEKEEVLEAVAQSALTQIRGKSYADELRHQGITRILHVGMAFQHKSVVVVSE